MDTTPAWNDPPSNRTSAVWPLLALCLGWGAGAAAFALVIQPLGGPLFSQHFALPPIGVAVLSGFLVGLVAAQITAQTLAPLSADEQRAVARLLKKLG